MPARVQTQQDVKPPRAGNPNDMSLPYYETDRALSEYLLFHYGELDKLSPWNAAPFERLHFPVRCVTECLVGSERLAGRALDLGCAVGRSSFELARHCTEVLGIDFSSRFIDAARHLQRTGTLNYDYAEEGDLLLPATAIVPEEVERARVTFEQGDAQSLPSRLAPFDVVLMANLIDRLPDPCSCLRQLPALVRAGGQLILTSPYTWLREYTPRENWLGGFEKDGKRVRTFDTLQEILSADFKLVLRKDLPFLIREHARKYQWGVAEATTWMRT